MSTTSADVEIPAAVKPDAQILWDFHVIRHPLRRTDAALGLGGHDIGVADEAARLFHAGYVPLIIFTGKNAPTTIDLYPRGEAVHFRERAIDLGVPADAIMVETESLTTGQNIENTRALLEGNGVAIQSATLISRPYQARRAYGTCRRLWPDLDVICAVEDVSLTDYVRRIADPVRVVNMLVGDTLRLVLDGRTEQGIVQPVPRPVLDAYHRLVSAGYTSRLLPEDIEPGY